MTKIMLAQFARLAVCVAVITTVACGAGPNPVSGPTTTAPGDSPSPSPSPAPPPGGTSCAAPGVTGMPSSVDLAGGRYPIAISIPAGCSWTARADLSWGDVAPGSGSGDSTVTLTIEKNENRDSRTLTVTVNTRTFRIVQNGPSCTYAVTPTSLDLGWDQGTTTVTVTTNLPQCAWTATSSGSWIRPRTTSGSGSATVTVDIDRNGGRDPRNAVITIAGQRVTVVQGRQP